MFERIDTCTFICKTKTKFLKDCSIWGKGQDIENNEYCFLIPLCVLQPLLSMEDNEEKALLSVGSLIHSYCTSSGVCDQDTVVKKMIAAIENKIAKGCKVARGDFKSVSIVHLNTSNTCYLSF